MNAAKMRAAGYTVVLIDPRAKCTVCGAVVKLVAPINGVNLCVEHGGIQQKTVRSRVLIRNRIGWCPTPTKQYPEWDNAVRLLEGV